MFMLLDSKPCILNNFWLLLETPRNGEKGQTWHLKSYNKNRILEQKHVETLQNGIFPTWFNLQPARRRNTRTTLFEIMFFFFNFLLLDSKPCTFKFILWHSKPCILVSFGLLLETPRNGKTAKRAFWNPTKTIYHFANFFHLFGLTMFMFFILKTMYFQQFWATFGHPSKWEKGPNLTSEIWLKLAS